jgi:hypothetical protein
MHQNPRHIVVPVGKRLIWRPYRREGDRVIWARNYGFRAWPILVDIE